MKHLSPSIKQSVTSPMSLSEAGPLQHLDQLNQTSCPRGSAHLPKWSVIRSPIDRQTGPWSIDRYLINRQAPLWSTGPRSINRSPFDWSHPCWSTGPRLIDRPHVKWEDSSWSTRVRLIDRSQTSRVSSHWAGCDQSAWPRSIGSSCPRVFRRHEADWWVVWSINVRNRK